ncbi:MAG TPA: SRPBCC domain-containing protein [Myxococcales bacterium]|nr:SRPBCC domain-containing protein [Myxococcales bacterium]
MNAEKTQSIVTEYQLLHPPRKVWRALTEPALLGAWLMPNDFSPVVGHRFTFKAQPVPGWDGTVHCEVLEVDPPNRLRYAWRGGAKGLEGYGTPLDTVVAWTLTPAAGGTLLRLEHSGFGRENAFAFDAMGKGWKGMGGRLEDVLAKLE